MTRLLQKLSRGSVRLLLFLFALLAWQNVSAEEATIYWESTLSGANEVTLSNGFKIAITGNDSKKWSKGNGNITLNSTAYTTLKNSNGAQNTLTAPEGYNINAVRFYAVTNDAAATGKLSEFEGAACADEVSSLQDYAKPTEILKILATPADKVTFTFGTKQVCFMAVVYYSNDSSRPCIITDLAATGKASAGTAKEFSIVASGATSYQWYKAVSAETTEGATAISGATSATCSYTPEAAGTDYIFCIAKNANGDTYSKICTVTVAAARTFVDFKVDGRKQNGTVNYTVVAPETGLPSGVSITTTGWNGDQHGATGAVITVPVDGPVKFTLGGCQYGADATVSIDGGEEKSIPTQAAGCDNGYGTYTKYATYTYNVEKTATLTFKMAYLPYFFAEKCEFIPSVTVTYFNTDGTKIADDVVDGGSELKFNAEYADKVKVSEGMAFRGWFISNATTATKAVEGTALTEDTKLYAKATMIEKAVTGTHFDWDLTKPYFYDEDHEAINMPGGKFKDTTHGWTVAKTNSIKIAVGGKASVSIKNCKYSATQTATVTNLAGEQVSTCDIVNNETADGSVWSFKYDGSAPDTLTVTFPSGGYVHGVEVYNVAAFPEKDAAGYYEVASGDGASLMMLIKTAQKGDKIYLPNGTYDFGTTCLTSVPDSVAIIGQSQDGVIIRNTPLEEGIGVTATLLFTGKNIYLQDLSLQCSAEKCATPSASRCVAIQDKGTNNICKNVSLLSGQDTYYSNGAYTQRAYFEDCYITGTVDYLCGGGDVVFNRVKHYVLDRSNANVIVAANTDALTKWGYVLLNNTIDCADSQVGKYNFGRPWNNSPAATWINTKMLKKGADAGYTNMTAGLAIRYHEYNTQDPDGNVVTSHNLDACGGAATSDAIYLDEAAAAKYTIANVFATGVYDGIAAWDPEAQTKQVTEMPKEGVFLLEDGSITNVVPEGGKVRVANVRGGFGPTIDLGTIVEISTDKADVSKEGSISEDDAKATVAKVAENTAITAVNTGIASAVKSTSAIQFKNAAGESVALPENATIKYSFNISCSNAAVSGESSADAVITEMVCEVTPMASFETEGGEKGVGKVEDSNLNNEEMTFRLPVTDPNATFKCAAIKHVKSDTEKEDLGNQTVQVAPNGDKYIELKVTSFSKYSYKLNNDAPTAIKTVNADANVNADKAQGKYFVNGQLIIVKDGKKFNAAGQEIK